ncbi:MAG: hypothetical protein KDE27_11850 [Planctomycetes bacterium]|nr:hypothetical protein [Planctomycetota bacterium]
MTRCNPFPFFAAALAGTVLHAQCTNPWLPGTGYPGVLGRTADATAWDPDGPGPATDRLVLVGDFTLAGSTAAYQLAVFDPATGAWSELGGNPDGDIRAVLALPNGDLIAAGDFRHIGGVLVDYIARWDGTSWLAIGGGMSSSVYSLALAPNGDVVAGGTFSQAGGITALRVARWNGLMWSAIGTGIGPGSGSRVASLAIAPNGDIAAGGYLRTGSGSVGSPFRYWDGVSWGSLGFGAAANEVRAVAIRPNGNIAVGGLFNLVGGTPVNYVAEWNGSSWVPLGAGNDNGTDNWVNELAVAPNGDLLVGGNFTRAGSIVAAKVARWDGTSWSSFGGGVTTHPTEYVLTLTSMPNGDLFVSGSFETAGGVPARSVARWDGAGWSAVRGSTEGARAGNEGSSRGAVLY